MNSRDHTISAGFAPRLGRLGNVWGTGDRGGLRMNSRGGDRSRTGFTSVPGDFRISVQPRILGSVGIVHHGILLSWGGGGVRHAAALGDGLLHFFQPGPVCV